MPKPLWEQVFGEKLTLRSMQKAVWEQVFGQSYHTRTLQNHYGNKCFRGARYSRPAARLGTIGAREKELALSGGFGELGTLGLRRGLGRSERERGSWLCLWVWGARYSRPAARLGAIGARERELALSVGSGS